MYLRKEMKERLPEGLCRYVPQPLVAFLVTGLAFGLVALTAAHTGSIFVISARDFVLLILVVAVVLAEHFPIHVRENTKVQMTTAPIYLIAVLYPPAIAAAAAGFAMLTGELTVRRQKGNYPSDIATDVGRWMIAALAGSEAIRVLAPNIGPMGALAAAASVMWAWDMLSAPATLSPISGENPPRVIVSTVREAGPAEAAQYVIGILAAVLSEVQPWTMALLGPSSCLHSDRHQTVQRDARRNADDAREHGRYGGFARHLHGRSFSSSHRTRRRHLSGAGSKRSRCTFDRHIGQTT